MNKTACKKKITIIKGDITRLSLDAIVNAANHTLLGGGGVDGAIHRAAGPELLEACKKLNGCKTGEAKITKGYGLPAKQVIHTVGPVWHGGNNQEAELLANCYENSLKLAAQHQLKTIAFPAISTGVYGFPFALASRIALSTTFDFMRKHDLLEKISFVLFDAKEKDIFLNIYEDLL